MLKPSQVTMTEGSILKSLVLFSIPLLIGNVFQQLYNTVDSAIVGTFVGKEALAAVGCVDPIINAMIGTFMGLSVGATVVISQYYGAKDDASVSRAVHTTIALTAILSAVCTAVSIASLPALLRLMEIPPDVYDLSYDYLFIYFSGSTGLLFYNMASGILRAVGDSRRPLYFLVFSSGVNIALDVVLVVVCGLGVKGAGYATLISQLVSAALVLFVLSRESGAHRFVLRRVRIDAPILSKILRIGVPSALQLLITQISNVVVQAYINVFGSSTMAGWSTYQKIDKLSFLPIISIGLATTTFVGQNIGAGRADRARRGTTIANIVCACISFVTIVVLVTFAPSLVDIFTDDPEVLEIGTTFVRMMMPFFMLVGIYQTYASALRGAGDARTPVIVMIGTVVIFRQIYLAIVSRFTDSVLPIALGYPLGWVFCSTLMYIGYRRCDMESVRVAGK